MSHALDLANGKLLVKKAREAVLVHFEGKKGRPLEGAPFDSNLSVFVTLSTYPKGELRGCIGFMGGEKSLGQAIVDASIHAAFGDSRFEPLTKPELESVVFEVSVLGEPEELNCPAPERKSHIKIGQDGLIAEYGGHHGILLAQVAAEWNFTPTEFLEALCEKAGLPKEMHKSRAVRILKFKESIFHEQSPNGKIVQKKLVV